MSEPAGIEAPLHVDAIDYGDVYRAGYAHAVADIRAEARRRYAVKDEATLRYVSWIADAVLPEVTEDD